MDRTLPTWLTALTAVLVVTNLFVFGIFTLVHPELPWPALGAGEAADPIRFFSARHIAFGVVLAWGLVTKDLGVLRACYSIFFALALVDFGILAVFGYPIPVLVRLVGELPLLPSLAMSLTLFIGPMGFTTWWLHRNQRPPARGSLVAGVSML